MRSSLAPAEANSADLVTYALQRVIQYGWTAKRFGEFDHTVHLWKNMGREAHKAERIGKKYQWIAYHELLARLSDNFYMRRDRFANMTLREYTGPWDIGYSSGDPTSGTPGTE